MNRLIRLATISLLIVIVGAVVFPAVAQEPAGGIILEGQAGADPSTLDPILCTDTTCSDINEFIFPDLLAVDPATASFTTSGPDALVNGWEISDDGLTYTFSIREDMVWNDGTSVSVDDVIYTWEAIASGEVETPLVFVLDAIESVEKVDDTHFAVTFYEANCDALNDIANVEPYPSHIAPENFSDLPDQDFALNPTVSAGVFDFGELRPSESISLVANQNYVDAELGYVNPEGYIAVTVPDLTVMVERFLAGELNVIDGPQEARRGEIYDAQDAGDVNVYTYPGQSWDYLAFNLADPTEQRDGLDADGNPIDQGVHPLFGNTFEGRDVRYALNLAINVDEIIEGATFGEGTRMPAHEIPSSWAYDDELDYVDYDPDMAAQILDEAGWPNSDPDDPTSVRVCDGCGTAEDGTEFVFSLATNEENARRTAIITIAQDQWAQIGVQAEIETIEFFTLLDIIDAQEWDAYVLGWRSGYPNRPDSTQLFTAAGDALGGSNSGSYNNPEFTALNTQAKALDGCDQAERAELYHQMQEIIQYDTPYIFLFVRNGFYAVRNDVTGFDPYPNNLWWNVDTWAVESME